jgi:hypothetical protein
MLSVVVPPFVNVTTFCAPTPPTATDTQLRLAGLTDALPDVELVPVPVRLTVCGLLVAESVKLRLAVRVPVAAGLNTTEAEQLVAAARLVPHVLLEMLKSPGFVPVIAMLLMLMEELVPFDSVTDCAPLLDPVLMLPNERLLGLAATLPDAGAPYPVSATFCGLLLAESVKFNVADRLPVVVGPKMIFAVQLDAAARVVPHVLLKISKSPGFVPVKPMLLIVMAAVPLFVSVTTFCAPLPPTGTETQFSEVGETDTWAVNAAQGATRQAANIRIAHRLFRMTDTGGLSSTHPCETIAPRTPDNEARAHASSHDADHDTAGPPEP